MRIREGIERLAQPQKLGQAYNPVPVLRINIDLVVAWSRWQAWHGAHRAHERVKEPSPVQVEEDQDMTPGSRSLVALHGHLQRTYPMLARMSRMGRSKPDGAPLALASALKEY
eukprot:scaffold2936_cov376-Prasinococcus_capsulatus_cf.AAC.2